MNRVCSILILVFALAGICGEGCGSRPKSDPKAGVVATIAGRDILISELQREIARRAAKGVESTPEKVLEEMVLQEVLVARARQLGLDQDPGVIQAYENLLIARLKERELEPEFQKGQGAVQSSETASADSAGFPSVKTQQIRLAILRQAISSTASASRVEQMMARMTEVRERAMKLDASEAGFGAMAIENSDDQESRYRGGDLGWMAGEVGKLRYDESMLAAGFALRSLGEISPVIRGRDGLYLVKLQGRRAIPTSNSGEGDRAGIASRTARLANRRSFEKAFEETSRAQVGVTIYPEKLHETRVVADSASVPLPQL